MKREFCQSVQRQSIPTNWPTRCPTRVLVASAIGLLCCPNPGIGALSANAGGAEERVDKREFTLFNPTPRQFLREMSTDRPDFTESPFTVDAGHFQVELSFLEYTHDNSGGGVDQYAVLPTNLKLGLFHCVDLQLVLNPYLVVDADDDTTDGFGDTQLRAKINLWGNDGGTTALGLMPFIQFPTAADDLGSDRVEGGLIIPFSLELPWGWSLGLMAELDAVRNSANDDYGFEFVHTVALGRGIAGPLGGYVEYIGIAAHRTGSGYEAAIGLGLTYGLSADVQLDAGANLEISGGADDVTLFSGISFRL
jgi:hypothetical protein